jgi:hypothetical protein
MSYFDFWKKIGNMNPPPKKKKKKKKQTNKQNTEVKSIAWYSLL